MGKDTDTNEPVVEHTKINGAEENARLLEWFEHERIRSIQYLSGNGYEVISPEEIVRQRNNLILLIVTVFGIGLGGGYLLATLVALASL